MIVGDGSRESTVIADRKLLNRLIESCGPYFTGQKTWTIICRSNISVIRAAEATCTNRFAKVSFIGGFQSYTTLLREVNTSILTLI